MSCANVTPPEPPASVDWLLTWTVSGPWPQMVVGAKLAGSGSIATVVSEPVCWSGPIDATWAPRTTETGIALNVPVELERTALLGSAPSLRTRMRKAELVRLLPPNRMMSSLITDAPGAWNFHQQP